MPYSNVFKYQLSGQGLRGAVRSAKTLNVHEGRASVADEITYDAVGHPVSVRSTHGLAPSIHKFIRDDSHKVTEMRWYDPALGENATVTFTYDDQQRLIEERRHDAGGGCVCLDAL